MLARFKRVFHDQIDAAARDIANPRREPDGLAAYVELLLPHALVATPNLREAAVLAGARVEDIGTVDAMADVAADLRRTTGARHVVVKGGHLTGTADDVVAGPAGVTVLSGARVKTGNDHGTGCSLSAAVAANLARGLPVDDAIAAMECRTRAVHDGGDHSIVVGEVVAVTEPRAGGAPLLYYASRYRRLRG